MMRREKQEGKERGKNGEKRRKRGQKIWNEMKEG